MTDAHACVVRVWKPSADELTAPAERWLTDVPEHDLIDNAVELASEEVSFPPSDLALCDTLTNQRLSEYLGRLLDQVLQAQDASEGLIEKLTELTGRPVEKKKALDFYRTASSVTQTYGKKQLSFQAASPPESEPGFKGVLAVSLLGTSQIQNVLTKLVDPSKNPSDPVGEGAHFKKDHDKLSVVFGSRLVTTEGKVAWFSVRLDIEKAPLKGDPEASGKQGVESPK